MAKILKGAPVAEAINQRSCHDAAVLTEKGILPTLAIVRVGEREDDLAYERGAVKRCENVGVRVQKVLLPNDIEEPVFLQKLQELNEDPSIHGILLFQPLPSHLSGEKARESILPEKDVDGCTSGSLAGVFSGTQKGFAPCTAQAAMEILHYYDIPICGKKAAVIGRSLVIGRPVAMMLLQEHATPIICHTRTINISEITKQADILIAAAGKAGMVDASFVHADQVVIDVGINWNEKTNSLCGDVLFEEVAPLTAALTPVPGGVGSVTTSVLVNHVIEAAKRSCK